MDWPDSTLHSLPTAPPGLKQSTSLWGAQEPSGCRDFLAHPRPRAHGGEALPSPLWGIRRLSPMATGVLAESGGVTLPLLVVLLRGKAKLGLEARTVRGSPAH